jgi:hypothetical protein
MAPPPLEKMEISVHHKMERHESPLHGDHWDH